MENCINRFIIINYIVEFLTQTKYQNECTVQVVTFNFDNESSEVFASNENAVNFGNNSTTDLLGF